jgi:hypothetical protein
MNTFSPRPSALASASATYWRITPAASPAPSPAPGRARATGARAAPAPRWRRAIVLQLAQDAQVDRVEVHHAAHNRGICGICRCRSRDASGFFLRSTCGRWPAYSARMNDRHPCPLAGRPGPDRPRRDRRMARRLPGAGARRARARALHAGRAGAAGAQPASAGSPSWSRPTSTPSRWRRSRLPGDLAIEERLASLMRWNALAMVVRANQAYGELGGHIASYASAADLFEVGFNHFFRARNAQPGRPGVLPAAQRARRLRARLPRRPAERADLAHYRQEITAPARARAGLSSYPHPWLMPDFWQFPTGSMGIGPHQLDLPRALHALPHAPRPARLHAAARCGASSATARWTSPRA